MLPTRLSLLFAAIYLAVDVAYVAASRGYYGAVAGRISKSPDGFPTFTAARAAAAVMSYAALTLAWIAFVPLAARAWAPSLGGCPTMAALLAGFVLALAVYGVFNGTLYVMFADYDASVVRRDMTWGLTWMTLLSGAYGLTIRLREGRIMA